MKCKYFMSSTVPQVHSLSRLPSTISEELPVLSKLHYKIQDKQDIWPHVADASYWKIPIQTFSSGLTKLKILMSLLLVGDTVCCSCLVLFSARFRLAQLLTVLYSHLFCGRISQLQAIFKHFTSQQEASSESILKIWTGPVYIDVEIREGPGLFSYLVICFHMYMLLLGLYQGVKQENQLLLI